MDRQLVSLIKKEYPSISNIDDVYLSDLLSRIRNDPNARRILIEAKQSTLAPMDLDLVKQALRNFQLPEGWGGLLVDLATPLIEGIPLGVIYFYTFAIDPYLFLLVRLVILHALFVKKEGEDASIELAKDEAYAQSLAGTAQELSDVLELMPKLRNGGPRLFWRMVSCIETLLKTTY